MTLIEYPHSCDMHHAVLQTAPSLSEAVIEEHPVIDVQLCFSTDMLFVSTKFTAYLTNSVCIFTNPSLEMRKAYEVWPENSVTQLNVKSN